MAMEKLLIDKDGSLSRDFLFIAGRARAFSVCPSNGPRWITENTTADGDKTGALF
jgi:hypothetical protein